MKIIPNTEFVEKTYDKTIATIEKEIGTARGVKGLIEELGNRYALAPASSRKIYYSSFPGGLAFHNLHMHFWMKKLVRDLGILKEINDTSVAVVSFLHELGKVGDRNQDYYIPQESKWHMDNGIFYEINPDLQYMRTPHRSVWLAQDFGIRLTQDEYLAIMLYETKEEEVPYKYKMPALARVTQMAYQWSTQAEKKNEILWPG